jgi:PAS domain S-box-containing protein
MSHRVHDVSFQSIPPGFGAPENTQQMHPAPNYPLTKHLLQEEGYLLYVVSPGENGPEISGPDGSRAAFPPGIDVRDIIQMAAGLGPAIKTDRQAGYTVTVDARGPEGALAVALKPVFDIPVPGIDRAALFERLPDLVALVDHHGAILYVNPAGLEMLEVSTLDEITGQQIDRFIREDESLSVAIPDAPRFASFTEQKLLSASGRAVPVETLRMDIDHDSGPGTVIMARDLSGRKAIERALSESQTLFYRVFQSGPTATCLLNLSDGRILDANEQFCQLTGYEVKELVAADMQDLEIWPQKYLFALLRQEVDREETLQNTELQIRSRNGRLRTLLASLQRLDVRGEPAILLVATDISERRRVAKAERESRILFQKIFRSSPAGVAISRWPEDRLIEVNDQWVHLTGRARDSSIGRTTAEIGLWSDTEVSGLWDRLEKENHVSDVELTLTSAQGEDRTILASFQRTEVEGREGLLSVLTDITHRKRHVDQLEESERQFRELAQAVPVLIWTSDGAGYRRFFNDHWLEFTGRSTAEETGDGWLHSVHPEDRERSVSLIRNAVRERRSFELEYRLRRADGIYRWVLDNGLPRYSALNEFEGYLGSCTDVTALKEVEMRLAEARDAAEKMAELRSTFVMNMTHEVRTPLTVILGFTSMLHQGVRPEYKRFVNVIERSGRRLLLMLDSILDLAQLEAGTLIPERKPFNVVETVSASVSTFQPIASERNIYLNVDLPPTPVLARFDHRVLSRVLSNLLDNAIKFTEKGEIRIAVETRNGQAVVSVRDTGIGIHEDFLPYVFDEFSQESTGMERSHQGSGLGLAVSRRLVDLMGGSIAVESEKDVGSTFTVSLPLAARNPNL